MQKIDAGYKYYNANSKAIHTEDCVKRAISIAYKMDYDEVARGLNKVKRKLNYSAFNVTPVFKTYMFELGLVRVGKCADFNIPKSTTVKEFCEIFSTGTYVLSVGKVAGGPSDHLVCIIDGDFWDTWDCSSRVVSTIYVVNESIEDNQETLNTNDIFEEVMIHIVENLGKQAKKMPWASFDWSEIDTIDKYTIQQTIAMKLDPDKLNLRYVSYYRPSYTYTLKINPRLSKEDNIKILKEKLWVRVREWAYAERKDIEDDLAVKTLDCHYDFRGDKKLLLKLPEWVRDRVTYLKDDGSGYSDRYVCDFEAFPEDPRYDENPSVTCYADTIPELRGHLDDYKKHFWRFGYDY